jgi:hypothetical protein
MEAQARKLAALVRTVRDQIRTAPGVGRAWQRIRPPALMAHLQDDNLGPDKVLMDEDVERSMADALKGTLDHATNKLGMALAQHLTRSGYPTDVLVRGFMTVGRAGDERYIEGWRTALRLQGDDQLIVVGPAERWTQTGGHKQPDCWTVDTWLGAVQVLENLAPTLYTTTPNAWLQNLESFVRRRALSLLSQQPLPDPGVGGRKLKM